MWDRAVDGRILRFHLAGLNHQNFIMADEETGSWWQQVTGECILGALKGKRLRRISSDEVTLATWAGLRPALAAAGFPYQISGIDQLAGRIQTLPRFVALASRYPVEPGQAIVRNYFWHSGLARTAWDRLTEALPAGTRQGITAYFRRR